MQDKFVTSVVEGFAVWGIGGAILLFMVLAGETYMRWREGQSPWSREGLNNLLFFAAFGTFIEAVLFNAALLAAFFLVYDLTPLRVAVTWWTLPLYFVAGEFGFYWFHRLTHEIRLFWADHSIHHSAQTFDFTVNLRTAPFQTVFRLLIWSPFIALGFHPLVFILFAINGPAWQTFCHTTRIGRFAPWFEWLFMTPANHAVHHASNPIYLDKNYGGVLAIWDHVFGTYQRLEDDVKPVFGITRQLETSNPIKVLIHEFVPLILDFRAAPTFRAKMGVLFGKPGQTFERGKLGKEAAGRVESSGPVEQGAVR